LTVSFQIKRFNRIDLDTQFITHTYCRHKTKGDHIKCDLLYYSYYFISIFRNY